MKIFALLVRPWMTFSKKYLQLAQVVTHWSAPAYPMLCVDEIAYDIATDQAKNLNQPICIPLAGTKTLMLYLLKHWFPKWIKLLWPVKLQLCRKLWLSTWTKKCWGHKVWLNRALMMNHKRGEFLKRIGSSGRTRTYNPSVNSGLRRTGVLVFSLIYSEQDAFFGAHPASIVPEFVPKFGCPELTRRSRWNRVWGPIFLPNIPEIRRGMLLGVAE